MSEHTECGVDSRAQHCLGMGRNPPSAGKSEQQDWQDGWHDESSDITGFEQVDVLRIKYHSPHYHRGKVQIQTAGKLEPPCDNQLELDL